MHNKYEDKFNIILDDSGNFTAVHLLLKELILSR